MSDYRYSIENHEDVQYLHVLVDGPESDGSIRTYIPIDDILSSLLKERMKEKQAPIMVTPPALFSNEQIEQMRVIVRKEVREEVRAALNENESERLMEGNDNLTVEPPEYQCIAGNSIAGTRQLNLEAFQMK